MGDATVNQVTFSVTAPKLPSLPKKPNVTVPKGNWDKFYARKQKFFGTKAWSIFFFLWGWAQFAFSAVTIYYLTAMDSIPSASASPTFPRFRHGNAQTQQANMQFDTFSEKHDLQVFLIISVALAAPLAVIYIAGLHKFIFSGADYAAASVADQQTTHALCSTLHFASSVNFIVGQVFYFRCLPTNSCFDAPYKTIAGIWIFYGYFYIAWELLTVLVVACCVSDEEASTPLLDGEEKDE